MSLNVFVVPGDSLGRIRWIPVGHDPHPLALSQLHHLPSILAWRGASIVGQGQPPSPESSLSDRVLGRSVIFDFWGVTRAELASPIEGFEEGGFLKASFAPKGIVPPNIKECF